MTQPIDANAVTDRQRKLIDILRIQLGMREQDLETITVMSTWQRPIEWPLTRKSASLLITELQLIKQQKIEQSRIS